MRFTLTDSFFVCRALQNVYAHTKRFRVQWLTFDPKTQIYRVDYLEDITPDSVLATVCLKRVGAGEYKLREVDRLETERLLKKSINKDKGMDVSGKTTLAYFSCHQGHHLSNISLKTLAHICQMGILRPNISF